MTFVKVSTKKGLIFLNIDLIECIDEDDEGDAVVRMTSGTRYSFECSAEQMTLNLCALAGAEINDHEVEI